MIRYHAAVVPHLVDAERIRPHPANANNGDTDAIIDSIIANGCYRPIYVDNEGTILAGHHLYAALMELGASRVPAIFLDSEGDESIRILLGDNKIARNARMDHGQEVELLSNLDSYVGTGYSDEEVADLIAAMDDTSGLNFGEDTVEDKESTCPQCGYLFGKMGI